MTVTIGHLNYYAVEKPYISTKNFALQSTLRCVKLMLNIQEPPWNEPKPGCSSMMQSRAVVKGYIISKEVCTPLCHFSHKRESESNCLL